MKGTPVTGLSNWGAQGQKDNNGTERANPRHGRSWV